MLMLKVLLSGQMGNNVPILYDEVSREAIVFDPSFSPEIVLTFIQAEKLTVETIFLTHGHVDHFAGLAFLNANLPAKPKLGLHRDDLSLFLDGGGAKKFRIPVELPDAPDFFMEDRQHFSLGESTFEARTTPGHTPGSVVFYIPELATALCGDLIFYHGVGRTDLEGGSQAALVDSIKQQVFTLPLDTVLVPGHGDFTTVQEEIINNPFIS
jgi:hydroxyacylglutathione hydrolase